MKDWPLLLAGPIVRRVEPTNVSVWVALKEPRVVRLSVFDAPVDTGPGDTVFNEPASLMSNVTPTVRVGENLHIAVATAASADPLLPGRIYAYNVSFGPLEETFTATEDLRSLLLLRDHRPVEPPPPPPPDPNQPPPPPPPPSGPFVLPYFALGYEPGVLPTFVMPPSDLTELRIAHGSCRRPAAFVPDLMPNLDDLIEAARTNAIERPHQLFLTGDQIYADDVAPALLHLCTQIGNQMMGAVEHLPISWVPPGETARQTQLPADLLHFPAGARKGLIMEDARMTTVDGESHLLTLGEFCAMHVLSWSNTLWPKKLPSFEDLYWDEPLKTVARDEILAGIELPPPIWHLHTGLYEGSKFGLKHNEKVLDDCEDVEEMQTFSAINCARVLNCFASNADLKKSYEEQTEKEPGELKTFRDLLPKVRRALANVATYMMFDDHEVTDDWNLSPMWRDRVFTSPLGRTILRNGLLGYVLCQGWGNDPLAWREDIPSTTGGAPQMSPKKRLLFGALPGLFPSGDDLPPDRTAADEIDILFGLDDADPPVKWHYTIDGPRHRVFVMDSRTRRAFLSRTTPPSNLSPSAMREQLPDIVETPLPAGIEVLFVVAPLPLLGVPVSDELLGPVLLRAFDVKDHNIIGGMPGTNPDAGEAWSNVPEVLEEVLARLAPYRRIVVLSGDVHYAHSSEASYWFRGDTVPARFAQFTSSGFKNIWPDMIIVLNRNFGMAESIADLFSPMLRLGWHSNEPPPVVPPDRTRVPPPLRYALLRTPVLLPGAVWPEGTTVQREPDWAWRLTLCVDQRPHNALPGGAKPAPLDPANPSADAPLTLDGYRQAARRHAQQLEKTTHTRRMLFASNFGIVTFSRGNDGLVARHDLFARPGGAGTAAVFTRHDVALDVPAEAMPTVEIEQPET